MLGADVLKKILARLVDLARERKVVRGSKLRVDTTVVETNVHYPTDSSLLSDGVSVLTRTLKKLKEEVDGGCRFESRLRRESLRSPRPAG